LLETKSVMLEISLKFEFFVSQFISEQNELAEISVQLSFLNNKLFVFLDWWWPQKEPKSISLFLFL